MDIGNKRLNDLNQLYSGRVRTHLLDCSNTTALTNFFSEHKQIKTLFHLAANSDVKNGANNSQPDFKNTLQTTLAIAETIDIVNLEKLIFASSSAVYGNVIGSISSSSIEPKLPISYYGWAKLASEYILKTKSIENEFKLSIVRFPNVVGPEPTHGILYDLKNKLKENPTVLEVLGNGEQTKPYMHVEDLSDLLIVIMQKQTDAISCYNIGPMDTINVRSIVDIILMISGLNPIVKFGLNSGGWNGDVPNYKFDVNLPTFLKISQIRNSEKAIFDSFSEWWNK